MTMENHRERLCKLEERFGAGGTTTSRLASQRESTEFRCDTEGETSGSQMQMTAASPKDASAATDAFRCSSYITKAESIMERVTSLLRDERCRRKEDGQWNLYTSWCKKIMLLPTWCQFKTDCSRTGRQLLNESAM